VLPDLSGSTMPHRAIRRLGVTAVLTTALLLLFVPPAMACRDYALGVRTNFRLGVRGFNELAPGTPFTGDRFDDIARGFQVITGISGDEASAAESNLELRARCTASYDERSGTTPDIAVGSYAAIAGIAIPDSDACPGDLLIVFLKTPFLLPPQFLPACLSQLPSAVFSSVDPLVLSDALGEGDVDTITLFHLPFIVASPVAYFALILPSGSPITAPPLDLLVTVCAPTTDGAGRLDIACAAL
jgi:hypothetical protein